MFFLFLSLLASIPLWIGITIIVLFKKNALSKIIFLFLLLTSFWQLDVTFLYSYHLLPEKTIDFFFRLFRFGSVMITPTIFYVAYATVQEHLSEEAKKKWVRLVNRKTLFLFYGLALVTYALGWSEKGISHLEVLQYGTSKFYFPVEGDLSWLFSFDVLLFVFCMTICFLIILDVPNKGMHSFLLYFNISTTFGFAIGVLNMFPELRLYPSAIAVLVFAISVLILSSKMYFDVVSGMNQKLQDQKEFLRKIIDLNPNYIYARDEYGRYTLINQSYALLLGMNNEDVIGKSDEEIEHTLQEGQCTVKLDKCPGIISIEEEPLLTHAGEIKWVQTARVPFITNEGSTLLAVSTDITERKQYEEEIKFQAYHDSLTGLPNRRMFNEALSALLVKGSQHAIMLIDLDRFKYINDTLGHDYGDLLLTKVSKRLQALLKKQSSPRAQIYRLGGDEFTILLPFQDKKSSTAFAKELLGQFKQGFMLDKSEYFITPSIGISIFPNDGTDAKTLMKHADTAMYYVKEHGKNGYQLFTKEMNRQFYKNMMIEKQLRTAIEHGELELCYQPIIDIKSKEIMGMEALLRWNNPVLGQVPPNEFISIAEETGMIIPIGEWVLRTALEQGAVWQQAGYRPLKIAVNISVRQLLDPQFLEKVKQIISEIGLDPANIKLEVTESIAMYESEVMIEKLRALKRLGISLAIDDFGTGYSSLSYLQKYPLDCLKIDRSFVSGMNQHAENKAIIKTIIAIARQLDLKVTAEGVESEAEYRFLTDTDCDYAQGYGFSKPLPAKDLEKHWLMR
nr:EAL domain-containing protein [uncultured Bacillus sp.]